MSYYRQIDKAVRFIEKNLCKEIYIKDVTKDIGISLYHFHRIFRGMVGETIGDYIRKRRLSLAATDLLATNEMIADIAFKYVFSTNEAFTRSFKKQFHCTPSEYRRNKIDNYLYFRKELNINKIKHFQEGLTMQPELRTIDSMEVVGMEATTSMENNTIPALWMTFLQRASEIQGRRNLKFYGLCKNDPSLNLANFNEKTVFTELVCVEADHSMNIPDGMVKYTVRGGKCAVFQHKGKMENLPHTYNYIYGTWIANSEFELDSRDDFELYDERFFGPDNDNSIMEIWIPVK